jgi:predicted outer membrane protein
MPRKPTNRPLRGKLNLTIHPEVREFAEKMAADRRRSVSHLFEDLVEAEYYRVNGTTSSQVLPPAAVPTNHANHAG